MSEIEEMKIKIDQLSAIVTIHTARIAALETLLALPKETVANVPATTTIAESFEVPETPPSSAATTPPSSQSTRAKKRVFGETIELPAQRTAIYCDGACSNNGSVDLTARAASAFYAPEKKFSWAARCPGMQTNQRAELFAAICATYYARDIDNVDILSDSEYVVRSINDTSRLFAWERSGWRKASHAPVANVSLWGWILDLIRSREQRQLKPIKWTHVRAHSGIPGNENADKLAKMMLKSNNIDADVETSLSRLEHDQGQQ